MFGKKAIIKMAINAFPPEKVREMVKENAPGAIEALKEYIKTSVELQPDEKEAALILKAETVGDQDTVCAYLCALDENGQTRRGISRIDLREYLENAPVEKLYSKLQNLG